MRQSSRRQPETQSACTLQDQHGPRALPLHSGGMKGLFLTEDAQECAMRTKKMARAALMPCRLGCRHCKEPYVPTRPGPCWTERQSNLLSTFFGKLNITVQRLSLTLSMQQYKIGTSSVSHQASDSGQPTVSAPSTEYLQDCSIKRRFWS